MLEKGKELQLCDARDSAPVAVHAQRQAVAVSGAVIHWRGMQAVYQRRHAARVAEKTATGCGGRQASVVPQR